MIFLKLIFVANSAHRRQKEEEKAMRKLERDERIEQVKDDMD